MSVTRGNVKPISLTRSLTHSLSFVFALRRSLHTSLECRSNDGAFYFVFFFSIFFGFSYLLAQFLLEIVVVTKPRASGRSSHAEVSRLFTALTEERKRESHCRPPLPHTLGETSQVKFDQ